MRRILVLAQNLAVDSQVATYAARIARASRAEVVCLSLVTSYASTAELIHAQSQGTIQRLRSLRARQTTADWVHTLETLRSKQWRETERQKKDLKEYYEKQGIPFSSHVVSFDSGAFLKKLEELMPVDLMISSKLRFPRELAAQGIMTLGDLGARFSCPAIDVDVMQHFLRPVPRRLWALLAAYGTGTLLACILFLLNVRELNLFFMRGGILPALAIMAAAGVVAWGYGRTVQCLFRLTKLDIY